MGPEQLEQYHLLFSFLSFPLSSFFIPLQPACLFFHFHLQLFSVSSFCFWSPLFFSSPSFLSVFLIIMRHLILFLPTHSCQPCYRRELISHLLHALIRRGSDWGCIQPHIQSKGLNLLRHLECVLPGTCLKVNIFYERYNYFLCVCVFLQPRMCTASSLITK